MLLCGSTPFWLLRNLGNRCLKYTCHNPGFVIWNANGTGRSASASEHRCQEQQVKTWIFADFLQNLGLFLTAFSDFFVLMILWSLFFYSKFLTDKTVWSGLKRNIFSHGWKCSLLCSQCILCIPQTAMHAISFYLSGIDRNPSELVFQSSLGS